MPWGREVQNAERRPKTKRFSVEEKLKFEQNFDKIVNFDAILTVLSTFFNSSTLEPRQVVQALTRVSLSSKLTGTDMPFKISSALV